jgi:hypothetical protein
MYFNLRKTINLPFVSFQEAKKTRQIPFWTISAIAIYTPFEDFIVGWLPIPQVGESGLRFIPEIILYLLLAHLVYNKIRSGEGIRKTPIDILIIAFFVSSFISIIVNGASIPGSIDNLRTNWRYLSVFYLLVNSDISQQQLANTINKIIAIGIIQSIITSLQFFLPAGFKSVIPGGSCEKAITKSASCGTFNDTAILSGFLLIIITVIFSYIYTSNPHLIPEQNQLYTIILSYFAIFASKKRAALLIAFIIPLLIFWSLKKIKNIGLIVWFFLLLIFLGNLLLPATINQVDSGASVSSEQTESVDIFTYFSSIFSPEYWEHTNESSRGWTIYNTTNALIKSGSWFGFGPELGSIKRGILPYLTGADDQSRFQRNLYVFEDPYWFAVMAYFGIVGLSIYWLILWRLYQTAHFILKATLSQQEKTIAIMTQTLVITAFFYSFVERLFKLRTFSFYFWLICGLLINIYCCYQERAAEKK